MSRRAAVRCLGGAVAGVLGSSAVAGAQTETPTGGGAARVSRRAVIPEVGPPFEGNYAGQFLLFTDPTPGEPVSPSVVGECDAVDWKPAETQGYRALLVDRLTDEPRGVDLQAFVNGTEPRIEVGAAFIVNQVFDCPGAVLALELEAVPVETFAPEYGTGDLPLVGESPGPTVSPAAGEGTDVIDAPGQPGFGLLAAGVGVGAAAWLRRRVRRS